jgi:carbon-monoxide dehydrogenase small subunit
MTTACALRVNGASRAAPADGADTLLSVLRDRLGLTGTKRGCNQGVCGACTVLVDGAAVRSCLSLALDCDGRDITTIEGLERDRIGAALQDAFAESGAVQCGFCTPGMLVSARGLLAETPAPTDDEIRAGLSGNLCRCSGYRKIIDAVRLAARELAR